MRVIGNITAYYTKDDYPSHFYRCEFSVRNVKFSSMEQMLHFSKAKLFGDHEKAKEILGTNNCMAQKILGREVRGYNDAVWKARRRHIAFVGNREKYRQNSNILTLLLSTYPTTLVEASKTDTQWGVGLDEDDPRIADPSEWLGENLHGQVQEDVRQYFLDNPEARKLGEFAAAYKRNPEIW
jgi:ribA/ribD-fused uncharacterized protein